LGELPTPVQQLSKLGKVIGTDQLYIKQDSLSGTPYGGNKVRKLEFLFGLALKNKVPEVMTFGCIGSNHALATAIYAKQLGIKCISILLPQPISYNLRKNILNWE
jgi:1-aminocyclopropane-1-carboxylate deaminase/D-cysteine desulfhydrase-like pyridoxal-dependent ACC family enzyme